MLNRKHGIGNKLYKKSYPHGLYISGIFRIFKGGRAGGDCAIKPVIQKPIENYLTKWGIRCEFRISRRWLIENPLIKWGNYYEK